MYRAKLVAFFISIYGVGAFLFGLNLDRVFNELIPPSQQMSSSESTSSKAITTLLMAFVGFGIVPLFENWIANEATNKAREEAKKEKEFFQENYKNIYQNKYSKDILEILDLLKNQNIPNSIYEQYAEQIKQIGERIDISLVQYEIAQEIVKWLSETSNRKDLRNRTVDYVFKNGNFKSKKFRNRFSHDVLQCLNWLSDRLIEFIPRSWNEEDEEELTSAIKANLSDIKPYENALNFIADELKKLDKMETDVIDYYINELKEQYQNWYKNFSSKDM